MTTFGEIVEPATRTAWEDWDDDGFENSFSLEWKVHKESPKNIDTIFIMEGKYVSNYIQKRAYLQLELINSIPKIDLFVFGIKKTNNLICLVKDYDLVKSCDIIKLLYDFIKDSKNVISLQSKPLSEYQVSTASQNDCIIRTISTSKSLSNQLYSKLEQPNIICGIGAGAISLREHLNLPGLAYVCYLESSEDYNIQELKNLLDTLGIKQNDQPIVNINNNLYI